MLVADTHPLNNLRVLKYLKHELGHEQPVIDTWARHWIGEGFRVLEETAEASGGAYLFGDTPGLADICLVPQMYSARRFVMDLSAFPKLVEVDKRLNTLAAVRAAAPEAQGDAPGAA